MSAGWEGRLMDRERLLLALFERAPQHIIEHLIIVGIVLLVATAIALPIAIFLTRPKYKKYNGPILSVLNAGQTIPPLAVIAIFLPVLGLGFKSAIYALVLYGLLPIARNSIAGLTGVSPEIKEAARGMGMNAKKVLFQVELPLALPIIIAGIRTSSVLTVSTATLAGLIGAGGLGRLIIAGLNMNWSEFILVGAGLGAIMAISLDRLMTYIEKRFGPPGYVIEDL
jgi:osmoprotectant transport system permease protein